MVPHANYPKPLEPGDTIWLVAPASVPKPESIERFVTDWTARGYHVQVAEQVFEQNGYLAGSDEQRAAAFMDAFEDENVNGVFAARGGYGANRIVGLLDFDRIRANPKIFAGFSDMTTVHSALHRHCGLVTFHAPHPNDGLDPRRDDLESVDSFLRLVTQPVAGQLICDGESAELTALQRGIATGRLVGGNLAVLAGLVGTSVCPDFDGSILFLEDIGEPPYRIDRYLSQLQLSGALASVAGVVLGHFTNCESISESKDDSPSLRLGQVLDHYLGKLGVPVLAGVPCGHDSPNITLPLNATVELDADGLQFRVA